MLSYRFYIRDNQESIPAYVEVDEPIGWDACAFTLQRSDLYHGLENIYSDDLTFYGEATILLNFIFDNYGFDASVDFKIEFYCENVIYTTIENVINMLTYRRVGNEVTVKMEESSLNRKLINRLETKINFNDTLSNEGQTLTALSPFDLLLHSKAIKFSGHLVLSNSSQAEPFDFPDIGDSYQRFYIYHPFKVDFSDKNKFAPVIPVVESFDSTTQHPLQLLIAPETETFHMTYDLKGGLLIENKDDNAVTFTIELRYGVDQTGGASTVIGSSFGGIISAHSSDTYPFAFSGDLDLPLNAGDNFQFYFRINCGGVFNATITLEYTVSDFTMYYNSTVNPSKTKAYLIYEAFNRVCESITDTQNSFRSNFFGRLNSSPQNYDENGCGAWTSITNGLNIRKMKDKDGNFFPISMSFFDLFKSCSAIWNLGMRIEKDDNGYYIRVEPVEYFYNNKEEIYTITSPADIETVFAIDKLYNDIEIGYEKWQIENVNGIDEFNTQHFYNLPLINAKQKLDVGSGSVLSPFIGGGYAIEMTRRIQYSANPTSDSQYDNDNFIICVNPTEVTSDKYSNPAVDTTYSPGEVAERNENYISVTNLISPDTAYNLRISPANMMLNWFKTVSPALLLKTNKVLKFKSGLANVLMTSERDDECSIALGTIIENEDIELSVTKFDDLKRIALFSPVYISFDYPLNFGNFNTIKEGSNKLIRVNCEDLSYFGFIKELKFIPNGGSATFKILLTGCVDGGFDSGFDSGFETGTC